MVSALNLWHAVVQAVGSLLGTVVFVGLDSAAGGPLLPRLEVKLVEVRGRDTRLVEGALDPLLVLNIVVSQQPKRSSLLLVLRFLHTVHVIGVLND